MIGTKLLNGLGTKWRSTLSCSQGRRGGECRRILSYSNKRLHIFRKKEALPLISANDVISLKGCPVTVSVFNNSDKTEKNCKTKVSKHSQSRRIKLYLAVVCFLLSLCSYLSFLSCSKLVILNHSKSIFTAEVMDIAILFILWTMWHRSWVRVYYSTVHFFCDCHFIWCRYPYFLLLISTL